MPEHVHLLVYPTGETHDIPKFMTSVKLSVAKKAINYLRRENPAGLKLLETGQKCAPYAFWMDGGGYDRNVVRGETADFMRDYIHNNPVRRGLVEAAVQWRWSSMREWEVPGAGDLSLDLGFYPY